MSKIAYTLTAAAVLFGAPIAALAQHAGHATAKAAPAAKAAAARTIEMAVTSEGFVPAEVKVKKGEPVRLAITRKTDRTCATEIVVKDYGIDQKLPLDKTVYVEFTPSKSGKVRYACGMDMIAGYLVVE